MTPLGTGRASRLRSAAAETFRTSGDFSEKKTMYANPLIRRWLPVATLIILAGWTGFSLAQDKWLEPAKPQDIVEIIKNTSNLRTLGNLLESAGLVDMLKGKGPFTVFAPTDDAFKKLGKQLDELQKPENRAKLQRILKHHVLQDRKTAADLSNMTSALTLSGEAVKITVQDGVVMVDKAKVTSADTAADNGLIHVVDAVLLPPERPGK
jgi:uncharacterized surface protein with fasciclin (FAS1) repeats